MPYDKKVDNYIIQSADFAKPILSHLRKLIHNACPDVQEMIKWGFPHFDYKGMLCNMAGFKNHCAFGFWKAALMKDAVSFKINNATSMGHAGKIKNLSDLPPDNMIIVQIKEAMRLNEEEIKLPDRRLKNREEVMIPDLLKKEFAKNKKASDTFNSLSHPHKKEYTEWINEAKTEETKSKRIATTIEWLAAGKTRNWKNRIG